MREVFLGKEDYLNYVFEVPFFIYLGFHLVLPIWTYWWISKGM